MLYEVITGQAQPMAGNLLVQTNTPTQRLAAKLGSHPGTVVVDPDQPAACPPEDLQPDHNPIGAKPFV